MTLRILRRFLAPEKGAIALIIVLQAVATLATLYLPTLNADIIDQGIAVGDTGLILRLGAVMLGVSLVQILVTIGGVWLAAKVAMGLGRDVRGSLFHHIADLSSREVTTLGAPTLISRSTNDVTQVQTVLFMGLALLVGRPSP